MVEPTRPHVVDVAEQDFIAEVIEKSSEVPVIVDFWAEWCGPCKTLGPLLEKIAGEAGGRFILAKVDADKAQNIAAQLRIQSLPTVLAFKDKQIVVAMGTGATAGLGAFDYLIRNEPIEDIAQAA